jgi:hypothetical protein
MIKQDGNGLRRLLNRHEEVRAGKVSGPMTVINDAAAYGAAIKPAAVDPSAFYWQAVRIHHLSPQENGGNHHLYLDVFDPALPGGSSPYGVRVDGALLEVRWDGGTQRVTIDKPSNEPGTNFPIWRWQVCSVRALGLPGQELPSDEVTGLHTGHPDETAGNTLFHHSFSVTFVKVKAPEQIVTESILHGVVHRAAGRKAILRKNGVVVANQVLDSTESFRFAGLGAGEYRIGIEGTEFQSEQVQLDGREVVQLDLTLVLSNSVVSGQVKNGAGRSVRLLRGDVEVKTQTVPLNEAFRFAGLGEGVYRVAVAGTDIVSSPVTLNGVNSATVDLMAPPSGRSLGHYVLFGPASQPTTCANMLLAQDYLLFFKTAFGFDAVEAGRASMVTIIGDTQAVPQAVEQQLRATGVPVQRIASGAEEIARVLEERIASKVAFS